MSKTDKITGRILQIESIIVQLALIVFKMQGKFDVAWGWVMLPTVMELGTLMIAFLMLGLVTFIQNQIGGAR